MADFFLADDLSGALDAAAAFHRAGDAVTIVLERKAWTAATPGSVVGCTTESRNAAPAHAAAEVAAAIAHGRALGGKLLYKKIDSTLRGPVAAELAAVRAAWPGASILLAPANPAVGRTVRDGILLVRGVPVAETAFGRDPASPVRESVLRRLLGAVADPHVRIPDTETAGDLARAVADMDAAGREWVGVGSGALAVPVAARRAGLGRGIRAAGVARKSPASGGAPVPTLFVCGSAHPGNREQAAVLARERGVPAFDLNPAEPSSAREAVTARLRAGTSAAVLVEARRVEPAIALQAVTDLAAAALAESAPARVFVTGGETAFALARALGMQALGFEAEIEPGLALARSLPPAMNRWFAIKPGGFGDAGSWVRAWDALQGAPLVVASDVAGRSGDTV